MQEQERDQRMWTLDTAFISVYLLWSNQTSLHQTLHAILYSTALPDIDGWTVIITYRCIQDRERK